MLTALSALANEAAPDDVARHAAAVVPHLCGDGDGRVCVAALDALDVLETPAIAPHAAAILARLEAIETSLCYRVVKVIARSDTGECKNRKFQVKHLLLLKRSLRFSFKQGFQICSQILMTTLSTWFMT